MRRRKLVLFRVGNQFSKTKTTVPSAVFIEPSHPVPGGVYLGACRNDGSDRSEDMLANIHLTREEAIRFAEEIMRTVAAARVSLDETAQVV
jgi:hypothetical protein